MIFQNQSHTQSITFGCKDIVCRCVGCVNAVRYHLIESLESKHPVPAQTAES